MSEIAVIRTSDRAAFKRCRRQWNWSSHMREYLESAARPDYFWLGSGGHYALEDYHGYNVYGHPAEAFLAYYEAHKRGNIEVPDNISELIDLGVGMLSYYVEWLESREHLQTLWVDGVPQCEVNVQIVLPFDPQEHFGPASPYTKVHYSATLDRVTIDSEQRVWVNDYKFNKQFRTGHYDTDAQIATYLWIAKALYPNHEIGGFIYQQHKKQVPEQPPLLKDGTYTTAKNRLGCTTHRIYRNALVAMYGNINNAPKKYIDVLDYMAMEEGEERDAFIIRDRIALNDYQIAAVGEKILLELEDILNPNLPLYPNPTKDCDWDCAFRDVCIAMDRNDDWEHIRELTTVSRKEANDSWRNHLA